MFRQKIAIDQYMTNSLVKLNEKATLNSKIYSIN